MMIFLTEITLWFCTKQPLSDPLREFAEEQGLYYSSEADFDRLFTVLRGRIENRRHGRQPL
jgi:hypothetical protein